VNRKDKIIGATLIAIVVAGFYGKSEVDERDDTIQRGQENLEQVLSERTITHHYTREFIKNLETRYNNNQLWNNYVDGRDSYVFDQSTLF
tara:strand:+ start:354 stop:623 length:270 start_codon:yes stop_codon:yes gene_type:complete